MLSFHRGLSAALVGIATPAVFIVLNFRSELVVGEGAWANMGMVTVGQLSRSSFVHHIVAMAILWVEAASGEYGDKNEREKK